MKENTPKVDRDSDSKAIEEWETLSVLQQKLITKGLEQADGGLGIPLKELNKKIREKHGLNC